jgi:hypothetical protein
MVAVSIHGLTFPYGNRPNFKPETVHPRLLCNACEGFPRGILQPNADFLHTILSLFSLFSKDFTYQKAISS